MGWVRLRSIRDILSSKVTRRYVSLLLNEHISVDTLKPLWIHAGHVNVAENKQTVTDCSSGNQSMKNRAAPEDCGAGFNLDLHQMRSGTVRPTRMSSTGFASVWTVESSLSSPLLARTLTSSAGFLENNQEDLQWLGDHETPDPRTKKAAFSSKSSQPIWCVRLRISSRIGCRSALPWWDPHSGSRFRVRHTGGHSQTRCSHRWKRSVWRSGTEQVPPAQPICGSSCCWSGWFRWAAAESRTWRWHTLVSTFSSFKLGDPPLVYQWCFCAPLHQWRRIRIGLL